METNNKLLAEFMGYVNTTQTDRDFNIYEGNEMIIKGKPKQLMEAMSMEFHSDWNWLMQVVEKIESLNFAIKVVVNEALIFCEDWESLDYIYAIEKTKIEATYNACVEFVKWYNEQK